MVTNVKQDFAEWFERKYLSWQNEKGKRASLNEFSDYIGYSRSLISFWLGAQRLPSEDAIKRLADLFGYEIYDILNLPRPNPYLQKLNRLWEFLPEDLQRQITEQAEAYETKNEVQRAEKAHQQRKTRKAK